MELRDETSINLQPVRKINTVLYDENNYLFVEYHFDLYCAFLSLIRTNKSISYNYKQ